MIRFFGLFLFIQLFFLNIGSSQTFRETLFFSSAKEYQIGKLLYYDKNYTDTISHKFDWRQHNNSILEKYFEFFPNLYGAWDLLKYDGRGVFQLKGRGFLFHKYQKNAIYFTYDILSQKNFYDILIDSKSASVKKLKLYTTLNKKRIFFINFHYKENFIIKMDVYKVNKKRRKKLVIELKEEDMIYIKSVYFIRGH